MIKIDSLELENVKRVRAVQLTPAQNGLTVIGGRNGQGKTSVLDAIAWALGGARFAPSDPAREGSLTPPRLQITLSNGLVVTRSGKNSALTVTDPSGARAGQQLLDSFISAFALDLPRFLNQSDAQKADTLLEVIGVKEQLAALDRQIRQTYDHRLEVGRMAGQKKKYAEELPEWPDLPNEPLRASELIRQQQAILARNGENQRKRGLVKELAQKQQMLADKAAALREQLAALDAELAAVTQDLDTARKTAAQLTDESTAELEANLLRVEEANAKIRQNQARERAFMEADDLRARYEGLSEELSQLRARRLALLQGAALPLPELGVDEDSRLTYKGRHWDCMSGAEQLTAATGIVRRLQPECGFVLLDKLEQLDAETLDAFGAWLESEGLQAIATRVSTGGECSVIIEDGRVAAPSGTENAAQSAPRTDRTQPDAAGQAAWTPGENKWKAGVF